MTRPHVHADVAGNGRISGPQAVTAPKVPVSIPVDADAAGMTEAPGQASCPSTLPCVVHEAQRVLLARMEAPPDLLTLAAHLGVTRSHLVRIFQRHLGMPPKSWLRHQRILRAKALLSQGLSIVEVALQCGFADQSHLTRTFTRSVGITPGCFREVNR